MLATASSGAKSSTETYDLVFGDTNLGVAANGDVVEITCEALGGQCGTFSVHPKSLPSAPSGEFVHKDSAGNVLGGGTWTATKLVSFHSYGCGEVLGDDIPDDLCGGAVKFDVELSTAGGDFPATLTVFCIIGPNPPNSHDDPTGEGVTLSIPGVINFNHTAGGENEYVKH